MSTQTLAYFAMNRGLVSRLSLGRGDLKRMAVAADIFVNYMPRVLGSMMVRAGMGYLGSTKSDAAARYLPFVFSASQKALLEFTDSVMRVWVNDSPVTRVAVSTAVTNGNFTTDLASWTDSDEAGGTSQWASPGYMQLNGNGTAAARRDQTLTVAAADLNKEHALNITIARGPVTLTVGTSAGDGTYVAETELGTGVHSLAFTPTGNVFIRFSSRLIRTVYVDSCNIAAAGVMELTSPYPAAALGTIRSDQSGDVVYLANNGYQQRKVERRSTTSWSIVLYQPNDGPFRVQNVSATTMTPSVLNGNGTLTASVPTFKSTHVGALFAVTSTGQTVTKSMTAALDATTGLEVTGVGTDRTVTIIISGMTAGRTVILQRSFDNSIWTAVSGKSWTADTTEAYVDGLDNQTPYYRLLCSVVGAAGSTVATLSIPTGSIRGVARVTAFTSSTVVDIEVLTDFGGTSASTIWEEGKWSDYRGWPTAVAMYEGRLGWTGKDSIILSVSDGFESFDSEVTGDSGPINRSIGSGPVDTINWALPLQRLILGGQMAEFSCRSTSFDEPLTPTNFNIKKASTQGSAEVPGVQVDQQGIYVQRGGTRVFALEFDGQSYDYNSNQLSAIYPTIGAPGIVRIAVQRQPDTRVHFVRSDGTVAILVFDKVENVICWLEMETDGLVEDAVVLPSDEGEEEDHVYYTVNRTINGATKRFLERWATEAECRGLEDDDTTVTPLCMLGDSYVAYTTNTSATPAAAHLEGEQVVVWADGADIGHDDNDDLIYSISGGVLTPALTTIPTQIMIGLPYTAQWRSGKLVQLANQAGTAIKEQKNISNLGMLLVDCHRKGVKFGPDFNNLDDLPSVEGGAPVDADHIHPELDDNFMTFPGTWTVDQRICLESIAPRPATVLAFVCSVDF